MGCTLSAYFMNSYEKPYEQVLLLHKGESGGAEKVGDLSRVLRLREVVGESRESPTCGQLPPCAPLRTSRSRTNPSRDGGMEGGGCGDVVGMANVNKLPDESVMSFKWRLLHCNVLSFGHSFPL